MSEEVALKYIGDGTSLYGVPARDLTVDEVEQYGGSHHLLASGLYSKTQSISKKPVASSNKLQHGSTENKE